MQNKVLEEKLASWHSAGQTITLVTGVFDVLHRAHEQFLRKSKELGDILLVGIESDRRVRELKGADRPVNTEKLRVQNVEKLSIADHVFILPEDFNTPEQRLSLLQLIKPDFLAVSSHSPHLDKKMELMKRVGGKVEVVMQHDPSISTTILLGNRE